MSDWLLYGGTLLVILFLGTVFFGAPYVPTRKRDVEGLFDIVSLGDVLVDLGSGDGRLVQAAASRNIKAYGIELSPILALWSWLAVRRYRGLAQIRWGSYWHAKLPSDTTVVFVFLADHYMAKLRRYLEKEAKRLGRPSTLVSYGFELPGYAPERLEGALLIYQIKT